MNVQLEKARATANFTRYRGGKGHYESYFMRANDKATGRAFWLRYTIFAPDAGKGAKAAMGELWAIYFEKGKTPVAAKSEFPLTQAKFSNTNFALDFAGAVLNESECKGSAENCGENKIAWNLQIKHIGSSKDNHPLFPLPLSSYDTPLPRAKFLVSQPFVAYSGSLTVNGKKIDIGEWQGSQNHNWGSRHTDEYAWGQVAGFDNESDTFLEVASAKLKLGPVMTPYLTPIVVRHKGQEFALNTYWQAFRNSAKLDYFDWHFAGEDSRFSVEGRIHANREDFVALNYYNPPGDIKTCINTKTAACELALVEKSRIGLRLNLKTQNRAAFEILTSKTDHGFRPLF
ncbi:MAG: hypothetical protein JSR44_00235 [Spirochaetes bacterium]|nr:hypothetical protein [Spirochaetota bacterium]